MTPPGAPGTVAVDLTPVLPGGENGGAKGFALELVRRLAALAPATHFVILTQATSHEELAHLDAPNVRRELVVGASASALRPRLFGLASRLLRPLPEPLRQGLAGIGYHVNELLKRVGSRGLLRRIGADLLFCPFTAPTYREPGIPVVCTIFDLQFHAYPQFFAVEDRVQRERAFTDACRHASVLAAISEYSRRAAIEQGRLDPGRIRTIHLSVPGARARAAGDAAVLSRLGLEAGCYFLYPANFWKHKNHEMLLTAFAMARARGLPAHLKLVCTGTPGARRDWCAQAARGLGLGEHVRFPGFLPEDELGILVAGSRALVFPSLYEGFGLPVVEAMANGVPVACSDRAALPEIAGDAAMFFDPRIPTQIGDALLALARDDALRASLITRGERRAARFSDPARTAGEYWDAFVGVLATRAS